MFRKPGFMILAMLCTLVLSACASTPNVAVDYDQEYRFPKFKTYAFNPKEDGDASTLYEQRLERAIENEMLSRAVQKVDPDEADILISYLVVGKEKIDIQTYYSAFPYHHGFFYRPHFYHGYGYGYGHGYPDIRVREYTEGTLVIDVINRAEDKVIWHAVTKERLRSTETPEERDAFVIERVRLMLEQFPPI